jgi:hypothetical protein
MSTDTLEALDELLAGAADADEALRGTVGLLVDEPGVTWAGIAFLDEGELTLGPAAGVEDAAARTRLPIVYRGTTVGELWVDGQADGELLAAVADAISAHVLIGWDTGGEDWVP